MSAAIDPRAEPLPNRTYAGQRHYQRDAAEVITGLGALVEAFSGATILLTGAAGFLGTSLTHFFTALNDTGKLSRPCHLVAADSCKRGRPQWLEALAARTDVEVHEVDIACAQVWPEVDYIIHGASIASPTFYRAFPIETMDANVIGLRQLLEHARKHPVRRFLNFSTSEIYGDPDPANIPTREDYRGYVSCTGPRACYDESKRFGETMCVNFHRVHQVPVVCVRPFNNYGPGLHLTDRRVIPDFFRDVIAGRDLELLSDGTATRTFCYVTDAIEGYLRALLLGRPGEAYNIGTRAPELSVRQVAQAVTASAGSCVHIIRAQSDDREYTTDNPQRRCPDLTKSEVELGYQPKISLEQGLARTYEYYLEVGGADDV